MSLAMIHHTIKPKLSKHCVGTLILRDEEKLFKGAECLDAIKKIVVENDAHMLGEQLHIFPNESFTLLVGMAESHISVHTWPERMAVQLDVFLCNYLHDNTEKCQDIFDSIIEYFEPAEKNITIIERL